MLADPDSCPETGPLLENIHASCVCIRLADGTNHGVLLIGPSGAGKSDLALRLIDRGAMLVADDRVDLRFHAGRLWASPPLCLAGKLEVRGLGIIRHAFSPRTPLSLAAALQSGYDRFPMDRMQHFVAGHALPSIKIDAFEQSAPIKITLALENIGRIWG